MLIHLKNKRNTGTGVENLFPNSSEYCYFLLFALFCFEMVLTTGVVKMRLSRGDEGWGCRHEVQQVHVGEELSILYLSNLFMLSLGTWGDYEGKKLSS